MEEAKELSVLNSVLKEVNNDENVTYTRQLIELRADLDSRLTGAIEWYGKQIELEKNNDEQLVALDKLQKAEYEYNLRRATIIKEYLEKVSKLKPDLIGAINNEDLPIYSKSRYIGDVKKYTGVLNGLSYYLRLDKDGNIEIFNDPKFSSFISKQVYDPSEWKADIIDII